MQKNPPDIGDDTVAKLRADPDRLWLEEASRRAAQIDAGEVELVSSEDVDRKARALLRES